MLQLLILLLYPFTAMTAEDFSAVTGPCDFVFPRDHGAHPGFRTEWWYYTGNLETDSGRKFGFQLTFFRTHMTSPSEERGRPQHASAWRTNNLFFAHAALADVEGKRFFHEEKMARGALGMAGVDRSGTSTRIFLGPWSAAVESEHHTLKAVTNEFAMALTGRALKGPVAHGDGGYSRKGENPESGSCYYSFPRLEVSGNLSIRGENVPIRGTAWMDHEFSSAPLEKNLTGWDWFSIQLGDNTELMIYLLRVVSGGFSPASSGTFVKASGESVHLSGRDFSVEVLDHWKSPKTGASYPSRWRIAVPSLKMGFLVLPTMAEQELVTTKTTGVIYWEGGVSIRGQSGQGPVRGVGYVELTGYAQPFRLPNTPE